MRIRGRQCRGQQARNLFGPEPAEQVVAVKVEMNVLKENLLAGDAKRAGVGQLSLGITQRKPPACELAAHPPDDAVDLRVGAKWKRVAIACQLIMRPRRRIARAP